MKKEITLLAVILLLLTPGSACVTNSVEVKSSFNQNNTRLYLMLEGRYNIKEDDSLYYYADNDSSMKIKMSNDSLILHSMNQSTNWSRVLEEELSYLYYRNATSLNREEVKFISGQGCCGEYENGEFAMPDVECGETFNVPKVNTNLTWLIIISSFIPAILYVIYLLRSEWKKYVVFFFGGLGWLLTYLIKEPILTLVQQNMMLSILVVSLFSGALEELIRYVFLKYVDLNKKNPLILALGWGVGEAVLTYTLYTSFLLLQNQPITVFQALPGAVERLSTTLLHVGLTILVVKGLEDKKFLYLSVLTHSIFNLLIVLVANFYSVSAWTLQGLILSLTIVIIYLTYRVEGFEDVKFRRESVE